MIWIFLVFKENGIFVPNRFLCPLDSIGRFCQYILSFGFFSNRRGYISWEQNNQVTPVFIMRRMKPFLFIFMHLRAENFCLLHRKVKIQGSTFTLMFQSLKLGFWYLHLVWMALIHLSAIVEIIFLSRGEVTGFSILK